MNLAGQSGEPTRRPVNGSSAASDESAAAAVPREAPVSMIGNDIQITGNIEAEVDLHIDGRVQGDVRCATLILGENSTVIGTIHAERVRVAGTVEGAIDTTDLAIEATARVQGDIAYSRLRIANGGVISGTITHKPLDESARLKLVEEAEAAPPKAAKPAKVHYIE